MLEQKNSKLSKFFNDIDEAIETFTNHDYGEDYKYYAKTNLKNSHYRLALLQFIDGCIEYTKDIFTVPAAKATAKIDNLCKDNLGLDLSEMAMTLYCGGLTAPLGAYLENVSIWANSTAAATGSKVVTTATAVTVEVANQAAGLVGVQNSNIFPNNPYDFNPEGLIRHEYKNGEIIKWMDKNNKAIYEWNKDSIYGNHYHFTPDGKNRVPGINGDTHLWPGDIIP